ncbi:MAG: D-Ala-D-Ala carboxypeptidase family metallohydrolase [Rhodobacterales bacterium]|nr:D-Ala-D-Ala carboxypeptidase family metallohydrolase [Rhodobacterales bacterium]
MSFYQNWKTVPARLWRWPDFSPVEIACRGTGKLMVNEDALNKLQALRTALAVPMIVNSGYRSPEHNKRVGGAAQSMHLEGKAFDISMANHDPTSFITAARAAGFRGIGTYPRSNFIHIDTGLARVWGDPFPARASRFAPDAAPAREHLVDSRTLKGGSAAGLGTVGAAGVEVVQNALIEAQNTIQPVMPYLDSLRWVFVVLALGGITVAIYARFDDWKRGRR